MSDTTERPRGRIASIVHTPDGIDPKPPDHYARVSLDVATVQAGRGIVTDRKGSRPERQLNVDLYQNPTSLCPQISMRRATVPASRP